MIYVYKLAGWILLILFLPFVFLLWLFSRKRRANLAQRLGFNTGLDSTKSGRKRIWVHALSVGEVVSSVPFVQALKNSDPLTDIVFTASTKTGFDMAQRLLRNSDYPLIHQLGYFPFDIGLCINTVFSRIQPDAVVIVETDLWPNFLYEMKKKHIPVILINARLSERSLKGYRRLRPVSSLIFSSLSAVLAQSDLDRQRFEQLGMDKNKIQVTGNIKFDQPVLKVTASDIQDIKAMLFLKPQSRVCIAGSTHDGEEKILLDVFRKIRTKFSDLVLIIAPRDVGRVREIESCCRSLQLQPETMTRLENNQGFCEAAAVVLVDKMGVLSRLYAVCDIAFIGGSLVPQGGHNPLEAAALAKPVLFGPHMSDFVEISHLLMDSGGAKQVDGEDALHDVLDQLLSDETARKQMGEHSFNIFCEHSGAVQRILDQMEALGIV